MLTREQLEALVEELDAGEQTGQLVLQLGVGLAPGGPRGARRRQEHRPGHLLVLPRQGPAQRPVSPFLSSGRTAFSPSSKCIAFIGPALSAFVFESKM